MDDDEPILNERDGGLMILTLNRPARLNAFTGDMSSVLYALLANAAANPDIRAVLLTGAGRGFCAGQDLADLTPGQDLGKTLEERFNPLIRAIRSMPKPVVCAVPGVAAGAGANLAFACDIVLAAHSAKFTQSFIRVGLIPDAGGTWFLPRLAGDARARGMAMLGEPVTAVQAADWGLIWRTVPDTALMAEARALAQTLAALPTYAIELMKQAFDKSASNTLDQQLDLERDLQQEAGHSEDHAEGVRAFLAKQAALFNGR